MATTTRPLLDLIKEHCASEDLRLPVLPSAAVEIQRLIAGRDFTLNQVSAIICKDQALASEVLRLANSAFFSGFRKVGTIQEAVMRLGAKQVLSCVVFMGQKHCYQSRNPIIKDSLKVLWKHAATCALGTKWLLEKTGNRDLAQEGFLAGLLHDVGKLLLLKIVENIQTAEETPLPGAFTLEVLENLHTEQGYAMMERWNLPTVYCKVIRDHHQEDFDSDDVLLLAVRTVNHACRKVGIGMNHDPSLVLSSLPEAHAMGVKEITLAELEIFIEDAAAGA